VENVKKPDAAVWFSVETQEDGETWTRIEIDGETWWSAETVAPAAIVSQLEPGARVRVLWAPKDRRRTLGTSLPFDVPDGSPPSAGLATGEAPPPAMQQAAQPRAQASPAAWPVTGQPFPAPAQGSTLDPLTQLFYVTSMVEKQQARQQELLIHFITAGMEREALRTQQMVAMLQQQTSQQTSQMQQHYQALDAVRSDRDTKIEALRAEQESPIVALATTMAELAEKLDETDSDELAQQLGDDASDAQRLLTTVQQLVGAVANSPLGKPIGEAIASAVASRAGVPA